MVVPLGFTAHESPVSAELELDQGPSCDPHPAPKAGTRPSTRSKPVSVLEPRRARRISLLEFMPCGTARARPAWFPGNSRVFGASLRELGALEGHRQVIPQCRIGESGGNRTGTPCRAPILRNTARRSHWKGLAVTCAADDSRKILPRFPMDDAPPS